MQAPVAHDIYPLSLHDALPISDCEAIREAAATARRAVVIGGGLLGLEAARGIAAQGCAVTVVHLMDRLIDRKSTRLNSSHSQISYAVFCLKKKKRAPHRVPLAD